MADRLRRARKYLAVAIALGPASGVISAIAFTSWLPGIAAPAMIFIAGAGYFRTRRFRPRHWPHAAVVLGVTSGAYAGSTAPVYPWIAAPVAAIVLGVISAAIANHARKQLLHPYTADLADSPVEITWQARGARGLELLVGEDRITLVGSRTRLRTARPVFNLDGVGAVEQVMVARRATLHVPDVGELRVTVTPGPAVRIAVPPGEWILPTDQGRDIAKLVARRKERAG